jgi:hypothetical protein
VATQGHGRIIFRDRPIRFDFGSTPEGAKLALRINLEEHS